MSTLVGYLHDQYKDWRKNREPVDRIREKCRRNFLGKYDPEDAKWQKTEGAGWRSQAIINLTRQKVRAAFAVLMDMEMQAGRIPFSLEASPWNRGVLLPPEDERQRQLNTKRFVRYIDQQLSECNADRAIMSNFMAAAVFGETYAKRITTTITWPSWEPAGIEGIVNPAEIPPELLTFQRVRRSKLAPAWAYRSVWNIFRDLEADDIPSGKGVYDREYFRPYDLRRMMGRYLWMDSAIKTVLDSAARYKDAKEIQIDNEETPSLAPGTRDIEKRSKTIRMIEYFGRAPVDRCEEFESEMRMAGVPVTGPENPTDETGDETHILALLASVGTEEPKIVRYARVEADDNPHTRSIWAMKLDETTGAGLAEDLFDVQKMQNGAIRLAEDNLRLIVNVILALKRRMLKDGKLPDIEPGLVLDLAEDCDDARKAVQQVIMQNVAGPLFDVMQLGDKLAEEESMIPRVQQGLQTTGNETAFEISQRLEKAGKWMGSVVRNQDEGLIEPMITSFYDYDMEDPDVDATMKGDYVVKSHGFATFQDRVLSLAKYREFMMMVAQDPELREEWAIGKISGKLATSLDIDESYRRTEKEKAERARQQQEAMAQQAALEVRKIMAQATALEAKAKATEDMTAIRRADLVNKIDHEARQDALAEKKLALDASRPPAKPQASKGA